MIVSSHIFHQVLAVIPAYLQTFLIGAAIGWTSPIISTYRNSHGEFPLTNEDCSWIASLHYIGRAIGCLLSAVALDRVGRIRLLHIGSILSLLIWVSIFLTKRVLLHYAIRIIFGLALGIDNTVVPIYVAENSSPNLRGIFFTIIHIFFFAGVLVAFLLATYTSYETVAMVLAAVAIVNLILAFFYKEPAQYLIMKGHEAEARTRFQWFRNNSQKSANEFDEMKAKLASIKVQFSWRMFLSQQFRIVAIISILTFLTGFPALNALLAFALVPTSSFSSNELSIIMGVALLLGPLFSSVIMERFSRRTLFVGSFCVCTLANMAAAALHHCVARNVPVPGLPWLLFASVSVYSVVFAAVVLSLVSMGRGELLPPESKAPGISASVILNSASGFLVTRVFLHIADAFGMATNFILFAVSSFVTLLYVYFYLPETKGMTLMEIQRIFNENSKEGKMSSLELTIS